MSKDCAVAVVQKIVLGGKHGAFAVAISDAYEGSITFSLEPTVWQERDHPEPGEIVYLANLRLKRAGWRAKKGRYLKPSDEQVEIRKEQTMLEGMKVFIERMRNRYFPAGDDLVWKKWVDYQRREMRDLLELLDSDVRDDFKRRAIFLLLVPAAEFNPIYWKEEVGKFYHNLNFLKMLSPDLLIYVTDLIVGFCTVLKPMHCDKPQHYSQRGRGIGVFWSVPDKYHDALSFYNDCILWLLTVLPDEQCERIFPLFSLNDISTFCNMEYASGYNPFQRLLYSKADDKYKRRADAEMRQIIREEMAGRRKPREEWESALKCYAYIVTLHFYGEKFPYGTDILAEQIQFLVSKEYYGNRLISDRIWRIYQILSDNAWKEIRYRVARFVVFGNREEFRVWDEESLKDANLMLDEFGSNDRELAERLQAAIDEGKRRATESQVKEVAARQTEKDILSQMR